VILHKDRAALSNGLHDFSGMDCECGSAKQGGLFHRESVRSQSGGYIRGSIDENHWRVFDSGEKILESVVLSM